MVTVVEALARAAAPLLSLEVTPPERGGTVEDIYRTIEALLPFNPQFITVTYHQPQMVVEEREGRRVERRLRKRPGSVGICAALRARFGIETVPHLVCGGFGAAETEDALIDLHYLGFRNLFLIRGDPPKGVSRFVPAPGGHRYAVDLVAQVAALNRGQYLEEIADAEPTSFCIGVAGYPEGHHEAPDPEQEIAVVQRKVAAGASFIITQMLFRPETYFRYVERLRAAGITVPVIPGIKPVTTPRQVALIPSLFHVEVPVSLAAAVTEAPTPEAAFAAGTQFIADLVYRLIDGGAPAIHLFTMGHGRSAQALLATLFGGHG